MLKLVTNDPSVSRGRRAIPVVRVKHFRAAASALHSEMWKNILQSVRSPIISLSSSLSSSLPTTGRLPPLCSRSQGWFSSVMADGSHLSLEENIAFTRSVLSLAAHAQSSEAYMSGLSVAVEAELGRLAGIEDGESVEDEAAQMTTVAQVGTSLVIRLLEYGRISTGSDMGVRRGSVTGKLQHSHSSHRWSWKEKVTRCGNSMENKWRIEKWLSTEELLMCSDPPYNSFCMSCHVMSCHVMSGARVPGISQSAAAGSVCGQQARALFNQATAESGCHPQHVSAEGTVESNAIRSICFPAVDHSIRLSLVPCRS